MEQWVSITDEYEVSDHGNVRSHKYRSPRLLKPGLVSGGRYLQVTLRVNKKSLFKAVHRLVCEGFHPNPDNLPCVLHKDNNTLNNHADNLMWGTQSDNIKQCVREGRHYSPWMT